MFPNDKHNDLNRFASLVWGNAQVVLKRLDPSEIEYIDLTGYLGAFQLLFGSAVQDDKVLIRDEYRAALRELETNPYRRGAYVTGQPGIGKTLFLIYVLVTHLGQKRAVALQFSNGEPFYALFHSTVTIYPLKDTKPLFEYGPMWALSDSTNEVRSPNNILCSLSSCIRVIQTTSPVASRWRGWSNQAGAECYVMDIWTEKEVTDLATLLGLDIERLTTLARKWGGVPQTLLRFVDKKDWVIEAQYRHHSTGAVRKCGTMRSAILQHNLPEDTLSQFYFSRPLKIAEGVVRTLSDVCVPTPALCRVLGEALQKQSDSIQLEFLDSLKQSEETRHAANFIYENWFHSLLSAAKTIQCTYIQSYSGVTLTAGTTLTLTTLEELKSRTPPYYWVAPKGFPCIDSALVLAREIFVFQVNLKPATTSPLSGLQTLRNALRSDLRDLSWRVVFVGPENNFPGIKDWVDKIFFPTNWNRLPILSSMVPTVMTRGVTYKVFHDDLTRCQRRSEVDVGAKE